MCSASIYQDILYLKREIQSIKHSNNELKTSNSALQEDVAFLMDQNAKLMDQIEQLSNSDRSGASLVVHKNNGQGILQQMSALMTSFNDHADAELAENNDLSVLNELSEMLKEIISNIAAVIKRNENDLVETKEHLQESLNQLKVSETTTKAPLQTTTSPTRILPLFQKLQAFNVSTGYKIGEIKSYHHNYEFSMEIKHSLNSYGYILQGNLINTFPSIPSVSWYLTFKF